MIIATIKLKGREEKRKEIVQTMNGISKQVQQMDGCISVHSYQDVNNENLFLHIEEWYSTQALGNFLDSKLFSALLGITTILADEPVVELMSTDQIKFVGKNTI